MNRKLKKDMDGLFVGFEEIWGIVKFIGERRVDYIFHC